MNAILARTGVLGLAAACAIGLIETRLYGPPLDAEGKALSLFDRVILPVAVAGADLDVTLRVGLILLAGAVGWAIRQRLGLKLPWSAPEVRGERYPAIEATNADRASRSEGEPAPPPPPRK